MFFTSYPGGNYCHVKMGNGAGCRVVGIGNVCLEIKTNCKSTLTNVRHILNVQLHLISIGILDDEG